jgi:hypothetical protein
MPIIRAGTPTNYKFILMIFISVHMINIAKQIQLMHNVIVYLFIFFVHLLPDIFRQVTVPLSRGLYQNYITCA